MITILLSIKKFFSDGLSHVLHGLLFIHVILYVLRSPNPNPSLIYISLTPSSTSNFSSIMVLLLL